MIKKLFEFSNNCTLCSLVSDLESISKVTLRFEVLHLVTQWIKCRPLVLHVSHLYYFSFSRNFPSDACAESNNNMLLRSRISSRTKPDWERSESDNCDKFYLVPVSGPESRVRVSNNLWKSPLQRTEGQRVLVVWTSCFSSLPSWAVLRRTTRTRGL